MELENTIDWTRINNDTNGNPRYVCHFLDLLTEADNNELQGNISAKYIRAVNNAKKIGGRKYHNKSYGGGVVFQSYNINDEEERILIMTGKAITCHRPPNAYEIKQGYGATHYRTFLIEAITNKAGKLKKWFKANDGLNYSTC